jgi:alpha-galactosidase
MATDALKVSLVGAGSRSFGPATIRDVLLSDILCDRNLTLSLMDIDADALERMDGYAKEVADKLGRKVTVESTTDLKKTLDGASYVVDAVEISRDIYWAMDFHIPRKHGFLQIYGENGGPGSHFHALRNMPLIMGIVREMERSCPDALLLNYTNPMHKLCEAACKLSKIQTIGLCHGIFMGTHQLSEILERPYENLDVAACGINHFTWFQAIKDKTTGEDLYPELRKREREGDFLHHWHELGLQRILFRRYGLYPSPGTNHTGEYIGWCNEFYASELHWFYDPIDGHPWKTGHAPEFVYSMTGEPTKRPFIKPAPEPWHEDDRIGVSGEDAAFIMESLETKVDRDYLAINVLNQGAIPNLADDLLVEVPATIGASGVKRHQMEPLPEAIAAMIRTQCSIQKLLVEAYAEESKEKLLQALLLEPTVNSYRRAVEMMDELLELQKDLLPPLH